MRAQRDMVVERMVDAGQWFEPGIRVEYFPAEHDPRRWTLEAAALGSYEVLACDRVEVDDHRWLDVTLRRHFQG
jgi:hypothetical protein